MLDGWLDARDAASLRAAWTALAPVRRVVTQPLRELTLHGAARLAGAMLGERAEWIIDAVGPPDYAVDRVAGATFVDHAWDVIDDCNESWRLHERRDGPRGVQLLTVSAGTRTGRPEGGSVTVVRIFDRDRAASVHVGSNAVATIGEVDLAPLDLYHYASSFQMPSPASLELMRGLVAQFAGELDAHYDTSTLWPGIANTFADGERAVAIREESGRMTATTHGLPWGHALEVSSNERGFCSIWMRLPDADLDRVIARLAKLSS